MFGNTTHETARRARYWTITREGSSHSEVSTIDPDGFGESLVVFGFEEEAWLFLSLGEMGEGWQARETTAGELVSMIYGPFASINRVVIDPLPGAIAAATGMLPLCMNSADFAQNMVDVGRTAASGRMPLLAVLRP